MNTIHKTKGIVIKTVKYGDTSIIASIYTEIFGIQNYIIKGIRKPSKKGTNSINYFYPAAILELQVYNNEQKNLQFIKEYQWSKMYSNIYFDVIKNAVTMFCIELLQHSIKQPESNPEVFYFLEDFLISIDESIDASYLANASIYFSLKLAQHLGFGINNNHNENNKFFDLQQGFFINNHATHTNFLEENLSKTISEILLLKHEDFSSLKLNQVLRRQILDALVQYFALHITQFTKLRSYEVLKEVL